MSNSSQRRLAIYLPSLRGGGAERVMATLANGFSERGYTVDLVLAKADGPYLDELIEQVRVVDLKSSRVVKSLPALARYLRRERPEAMLSAMGHANVVAVASRMLSLGRTRVVVSERANFSVSNVNSRSIRAKAMAPLMRWAYGHADGIIAISAGVAEDLSACINIPRKDISVVYNPVAIERVTSLSREKIEYFFPGGEEHKLIVGVGRLVEQKRFSDLIEAFAQIRSRQSLRLAIIGEGPLRDALENKVRTLGLGSEVTFPGFLSNPFAVLNRADLFVLSSGWEGFGNVLVEAMAVGTPVVSTACPSGPDEILQNGKWGRLVPVGDVEALANAMALTLDESENPDVASRAFDFSVDRAVEGYLDVLLPQGRETAL